MELLLDPRKYLIRSWRLWKWIRKCVFFFSKKKKKRKRYHHLFKNQTFQKKEKNQIELTPCQIYTINCLVRPSVMWPFWQRFLWRKRRWFFFFFFLALFRRAVCPWRFFFFLSFSPFSGCLSMFFIFLKKISPFSGGLSVRDGFFFSFFYGGNGAGFSFFHFSRPFPAAVTGFFFSPFSGVRRAVCPWRFFFSPFSGGLPRVNNRVFFFFVFLPA